MKKKDLKLYSLPDKPSLSEQDVQDIINYSMSVQNVGQQKLVSGTFQSANFRKGIQGWQLLPNGDLEANDATIRGTIVIGGQYRTVAVGDNIQTAIDAVHAAGGGTVVLANGTHTPTYNIVLYSSITLQGQNSESAIIDFASGSYQVKGIGSAAYTTGTVSVSANGTTVTGVGTSWVANATAGQNILLSGVWYPISVVTDNTHVTIAIPFGDTALSGATYTLATIVSDVKITNLVVKNSATSAVKLQYAGEFVLDNLNIQTSLIGIDFDTCSQIILDNIDCTANYTNYSLTNSHFMLSTGSSGIDSLASHGMVLNGVTNSAISSIFILNSAADGVNITSCSNCRIDGVFVQNAGQGIEFVSGNSNIVTFNSRVEGNTSDGIKLTASSDNIFIQSIFIKNNGGYGVNNAASSNDNLVITGNNFSGNSSGVVSDSGTGTLIRGNVGVADNGTSGSPVVTTTIQAGEALSANDAVYIVGSLSEATLSSTSKSANVTLSGGSLVATHNGTPNNFSQVAATQHKAVGKWYFEVTVTTAGGGMGVGISNSTYVWTNGNQVLGFDTNSWSYRSDGTKITNNVATAYGATWTTGDIIGMAVDVGGGTVEFYKNGSSQGVAFNTGLPSDVYFGVQLQTTPGVMTVNFSASAFTYTVPSGYNTYGVFKTSASATGTSNGFVGFAQSAVSAGATATIILSGKATSFSSLISGSQYYLSNTSGLIATSAGSNTRKCGIAISATELLITNVW